MSAKLSELQVEDLSYFYKDEIKRKDIDTLLQVTLFFKIIIHFFHSSFLFFLGCIKEN